MMSEPPSAATFFDKKFLRKPLFFMCFIVLFAGADGYAGEAPFREGEILVQLRQGMTPALLKQDIAALPVAATRLLSARMNIWLIAYESRAMSAAAALDMINKHPDVQNAQFNHFVSRRNSLATTPSDPQFGSQWALNNTGQTGGVPDADIDAPEAWDLVNGGMTTTGEEIVIAVIDGGIDLDHADLKLWKNTLEIADNGIDDDDNGYVDDYDGWNAYNSTGNLPSDNHGTHVAGIAAAIGNNALGVSGVNWNASVMPVAGSSGVESTVIEAYGYVLEMRKRYNESAGSAGAFIVVTNASFGVDFGDPVNFPLWCAIYDSLGNAGVLNCGATANLNINIDTQNDVPTACPSPFMIAVTNTTHTDQKNSGAAYGQVNIDLGAPGTFILSTLPGDVYGYLSGTSMATPAVSGAIALMYAAASATVIQAYHDDPPAIALQFREMLLDGVDPKPALQGITATGGRLNVFNSVLLVQSLQLTDFALSPAELSFGEVAVGATDTLSLVLRNRTEDAVNFDIISDDPVFQPAVSGITVGANTADTVAVFFSPDAARPFSARLTISNADTSMQANASGSGFIYAAIALSDTHLVFNISPEDSAGREIAISNLAAAGGEMLQWTIYENAPPPLTAAASTVLKPIAKRVKYDPAARKMPVRLSPKVQLSQPRLTFFEDDMENGPGGWTTELLDGTTDDLWHQTTSGSHSTVTSWWCANPLSGNYNTGNRIKTALVSPAIDLSAAIAPVTLAFAENYHTEVNWDLCMVDVSVNDGLTWTPLRGTGSGAVSGNSGGWKQSALDLSAYTGEEIRIRFHFDTGDNFANNFPGWKIDDVQITDANINLIPWVTASPLSGQIAAGQSQAVSIGVNTAGLAPGSYTGMLTVGSNDPQQPQVFVSVDLEVIGFDMTFEKGWNMVSLPALPDNAHYQHLFPGAVPRSLYGFNGSYQSMDTLDAGAGYWLNFFESDQATVGGTKIDSLTLFLERGWNMIGGLSADLALAQVDDPASIIIPGTLYGFNGAYFSSDSILQGKGYWLRARTPGAITLTGAAPALAKLPPSTALTGMGFPEAVWLNFRSGDATQTLFLSATVPSEIAIESFSLPPVAPAGFDARFSDNYRAIATDHAMIHLQADTWPVSLTLEQTANNIFQVYEITELIGEQPQGSHTLQAGESLVIANPAINRLQVQPVAVTLPAMFNLAQNYPNPFNPETVIRYDLPVSSYVQLTIFNSLGQVVGVPVKKHQAAGVYSVRWNGRDQSGRPVASGIYWYQLHAGDFNAVRKMVLLK